MAPRFLTILTGRNLPKILSACALLAGSTNYGRRRRKA